jgi:hypothetical protein
VVTSRATDDNLIDDQDARTSDIMAPPRQPSRKPAPVKSDPARPDAAMSAPATTEDAASDSTAGGGVSPNGTPAAVAKDPAGKDRARADDTTVVGVPALPADTIAAPRAAQPKASGADQATVPGKDRPSADDSPMLSFGPPSAKAKPAVEDPAIVYPAESAVKSASDDTVASGVPSPSASPTPAGSRPAQAEPPSVSPAAFAWEMPDPPPNSPSSPARTFLRSGTSARNSSAPKTGSSPAGDGTATAGTATVGTATVGKGHAAPRDSAHKASGTQLKRTARQAHLTVARVEPWSVMKFSFVVSLVAFVILFVAVSVLYGALAGLGVFDSLQRVVSDVTSSQGSTGVNAKAWFSASRVLGYTALLGSLNIVLITAMSTIGAVVYNLTSRLVGGVEVTLKETE